MFTVKQIHTGRMYCGIVVSFYHRKCLLCNVCCPSEFVLVLGFSSVIFLNLLPHRGICCIAVHQCLSLNTIMMQC